MKAKGVIILIFFLVSNSAGLVSAGPPVPVSPGDAAGTATTDQVCPTFSWSSLDRAVSYRLEIYQQATSDLLSHDAMSTIAKPVSAKEIIAPALSWTPSSDECLTRGTKYVWYVKGTGTDGTGHWSEAIAFQVEASALTTDQRAAVQEVVREYIAKEGEKTAALSIAGSVRGPKVSTTRSPEPPARTNVGKDSGIRTAQTVTTPVEVIGDFSVQGTGNLIVMGTSDIGYEIVTALGSVNLTSPTCANYSNGTCYYGTAIANCTTGKKVLGGGCGNNIPVAQGNVNESRPFGDNSWLCSVNSSITGNVTSYAICARIQ